MKRIVVGGRVSFRPAIWLLKYFFPSQGKCVVHDHASDHYYASDVQML